MDGFSELAGRGAHNLALRRAQPTGTAAPPLRGTAACKACLYPTRFKAARVDNKERFRFQAN
jgi:hypothetical protein